MATTQDFAKEFLAFISQRRSIGAKFLSEPAPNLDDYREAVKAALTVPDHCRLHPCRALIVQNRERLADLFAQGALEAGGSEEDAAKARSKALKAPGMVAFLVALDPENSRVPVYEQWMTAGGFATVFLNYLEMKGFAGKIVSGSNTRYPCVVKELCEPDEVIACWLMVGTEKPNDGGDVERPNPDDYLSEW